MIFGERVLLLLGNYADSSFIRRQYAERTRNFLRRLSPYHRSGGSTGPRRGRRLPLPRLLQGQEPRQATSRGGSGNNLYRTEAESRPGMVVREWTEKVRVPLFDASNLEDVEVT